MKLNVIGVWALCMLCIVGCNSTDNTIDDVSETPEEETPEEVSLEIVNAFPNLSFDRPVDFQTAPDESNRIFIVEQSGIIRTFQNNGMVDTAVDFLDIQDRVDDSASEMGLFSIAFHPNYATNGLFYVHYTNFSDRSTVSRFSVSDTDANRADAASETILLQVDQPFSNHNGGQLAFGPDNFLYIALGDGGSGGDPQGNAQNTGNLLGNILRIDVDRTENGLNYGIPTDNPFVDNTNARDEIFAFGLRNPWRMSFDVQTGLLWSGDVGQGALEEINVIELGNNYGWNILEGSSCFNTNTCDRDGLKEPFFEYSQANGDRSITGGYVYRGSQLENLFGQYVYADFASGRIWALSTTIASTPSNELLLETGLNIASFGTDSANELYFCSFDGAIYTFAEN